MNYTHYDYLELAPGADARRIDVAYNALLEKFQYGASDAGQDLSGLVRRIHAAYEILSDPNKRREYDDDLAREAAVADAELASALEAQPTRWSRHVQDVPQTLKVAVAQLAA